MPTRAGAFANIDPRLLAKSYTTGASPLTSGLVGFLGTVAQGIEQKNKAMMAAKKQEVAQGEAIQSIATNKRQQSTGASYLKTNISSVNQATGKTVVDGQVVDTKTSAVSFTNKGLDVYDRPEKNDPKYQTATGEFDNKLFREDRKAWRDRRRETRKEWRQQGVLNNREARDQFDKIMEDGVIDASEQIKFGQLPRRYQKRLLESIGNAPQIIDAIDQQTAFVNNSTGGINRNANPSAYYFNKGASENGVFLIPGADGSVSYGTFYTKTYENESEIPAELKGTVNVGDPVVQIGDDGKPLTYKSEADIPEHLKGKVSVGDYIVAKPEQVILPPEGVQDGRFYNDSDLIQTISMIEDSLPKGVSMETYLGTEQGRVAMSGIMDQILFENPELAYLEYSFLDKNGDRQITREDLAEFTTEDYINFYKGRQEQIEASIPRGNAVASVEQAGVITERILTLDPDSDNYDSQVEAIISDLGNTDLGFEYASVDIQDGKLVFTGVNQTGGGIPVVGKGEDATLTFDLNDSRGVEQFAYEVTEGTHGEDAAGQVSNIFKGQAITDRQAIDNTPASQSVFQVDGTSVAYDSPLIGAAGYSGESLAVIQQTVTTPPSGINASNYDTVLVGGAGTGGGAAPTRVKIPRNEDGTFKNPNQALDTELGRYLTSKGLSKAQVINVVQGYGSMLDSGNVDLASIALDKESFERQKGNQTVTNITGATIVPDPADEAKTEVVELNEEQTSILTYSVDDLDKAFNIATFDVGGSPAVNPKVLTGIGGITNVEVDVEGDEFTLTLNSGEIVRINPDDKEDLEKLHGIISKHPKPAETEGTVETPAPAPTPEPEPQVSGDSISQPAGELPANNPVRQTDGTYLPESPEISSQYADAGYYFDTKTGEFIKSEGDGISDIEITGSNKKINLSVGGTKIKVDGTTKANIEKTSPEILNLLADIQNEVGFDLTITSAYRDEATNRKAGGKKGSKHLDGTALDIRVKDLTPEQQEALMKAIEARTGLKLVDERGKKGAPHIHISL